MSEVAMTKPRTGQKMTLNITERDKNVEMPTWKKAFWAGEKRFGQNLARRGWSGRTWRGREFGPPETAHGGKEFFIPSWTDRQFVISLKWQRVRKI